MVVQISLVKVILIVIIIIVFDVIVFSQDSQLSHDSLLDNFAVVRIRGFAWALVQDSIFGSSQTLDRITECS